MKIRVTFHSKKHIFLDLKLFTLFKKIRQQIISLYSGITNEQSSIVAKFKKNILTVKNVEKCYSRDCNRYLQTQEKRYVTIKVACVCVREKFRRLHFHLIYF